MAIKLSRGIRLLLIIPFWATLLCVAAENEDNATVTTSAIAITIPTVEESGPIDALAEDRLAQLFRLYMEAQSTGMIDEAEVLAKQIIEMTIESFGFESKQTARALTDLGSLQTSNADFHAAILNYASAIEIIENLDDRLSMDLIVPLKGIGAAHKGAGNADLAAASWQRAVHISHVNFGPHNYEQIPALAERGLQQIDNFFDSFEGHLEGRRFAAAEQLSVADVTAFVFMDFAKIVKKQPGDKHANIARWRATLREMPAFQL